MVDDLSGQVCYVDGWISVDEIKEVLGPLLEEIGRVYAPALIANAKAMQAGEKQFTTTIDGKPWEQPTFPYQSKCLDWINEEYQKLTNEDKAQVDKIIAGTCCETMLQ